MVFPNWLSKFLVRVNWVTESTEPHQLRCWPVCSGCSGSIHPVKAAQTSPLLLTVSLLSEGWEGQYQSHTIAAVLYYPLLESSVFGSSWLSSRYLSLFRHLRTRSHLLGLSHLQLHCGFSSLMKSSRQSASSATPWPKQWPCSWAGNMSRYGKVPIVPCRSTWTAANKSLARQTAIDLHSSASWCFRW